MFPNKKIQSLVGSKIQVEMKGNNHILEGILSSADEYLNIHLIDTVEVEDEKRIKSLGSVVLRGNNIILVNPL
ncbi:MAG: LSM domain protein [Candidatus Argoarchaeum ethanivorans]|uniref:LSM domain protein n=2 Tax=GOM Arc I cluster TaxID=1978122 RepID=A0A811T7U2_9EURY|nr:LSM domain-containing protein [Candidatus Ethanoperedens thermophilum]RZN15184.1 MAG: LSM domain-containing protein [Methanosarcinales archaeon]CAD6491683.1 MAG: LSM domain protein [Candidatus Argoarchaeum ethanivorans]CAD6492706.1 MAG: LSM domain protein [Candidatus Argoarchaeum ethanivorans]CAD6493540.1 MAG: LSM domain protein [Candidatus Argoarchaeum ethanivorans]